MTEPVSNLGPDGGLLEYWTRQGISLTEVQEWIARAEQAALDAEAALLAFSQGALAGITPLAQQLLAAQTVADVLRILGITGTGDPTGGTNKVDDLTPVTPEMKAVIKATTTANALSQLGGLPTSSRGVAGGVAALDSAGDVVNAAGVKVILQLQGVQQQIATLSATITQHQQELDDVNQQLLTIPKAVDLLNTPIEIVYPGTAWPGRPATQRPVRWVGGPAAPPLTGSTSGGGGMATIDEWIG